MLTWKDDWRRIITQLGLCAAAVVLVVLWFQDQLLEAQLGIFTVTLLLLSLVSVVLFPPYAVKADDE